MADSEHLQRLLGQDALQRLLMRLRKRFENGGDSQGTLTLSHASIAERQAIERLLGRSPGRGDSVQIRLESLEQVIRDSGAADDLYSAVEILSGPLRNQRIENQRIQENWQALFNQLKSQALELKLTSWLDELQNSGLLKRLAQQDISTADELLSQALRVVAVLPQQGQSLSTLAANTLGDAHALDQGKPVATLAKKAIQHISQMQTQMQAQIQVNDLEESGSDDSDREIWASVGVLVGGAITSVALTLNLPAINDTATGRMLAALNEAGEPTYLTLRQLVREPPHWHCHGTTIYICENPAVAAEAAAALGINCAPLICTQGQPRAAVTTLLKQLLQAGAKLVYHGDFDWAGIRIGNIIMQRFAAQSWRFDTAAYQAQQRPGQPLRGTPVAACWDAELMTALQARNRQLEEEQVIEDLLSDLAT